MKSDGWLTGPTIPVPDELWRYDCAPHETWLLRMVRESIVRSEDAP